MQIPFFVPERGQMSIAVGVRGCLTIHYMSFFAKGDTLQSPGLGIVGTPMSSYDTLPWVVRGIEYISLKEICNSAF